MKWFALLCAPVVFFVCVLACKALAFWGLSNPSSYWIGPAAITAMLSAVLAGFVIIGALLAYVIDG